MTRSPHQRRTRRSIGGAMLGVGIVLLFVATWAFPEGLIHVARATAEAEAVPLSARGWFTAVFGPISLVTSGVLIFWGFWLRQANLEAVSDEDRVINETWGEEIMTDYDPSDFHPTRYSSGRRR